MAVTVDLSCATYSSGAVAGLENRGDDRRRLLKSTISTFLMSLYVYATACSLWRLTFKLHVIKAWSDMPCDLHTLMFDTIDLSVDCGVIKTSRMFSRCVRGSRLVGTLMCCLYPCSSSNAINRTSTVFASSPGMFRSPQIRSRSLWQSPIDVSRSANSSKNVDLDDDGGR